MVAVAVALGRGRLGYVARLDISTDELTVAVPRIAEAAAAGAMRDDGAWRNAPARALVGRVVSAVTLVNEESAQRAGATAGETGRRDDVAVERGGHVRLRQDAVVDADAESAAVTPRAGIAPPDDCMSMSPE
jgi:hypothetical protein